MADPPKVVKKDGATRFHRLAGRPGGISREEAIKKSNAFIETSKPNYHEWVARDIAELEQALAALRGHASPKPEDIEIAYHRGRAIRDLGTTMGHPLVTEVANSLCELLSRFKSANMFNEPSVETHFRSLLLVSAPGDTEMKAGESEKLMHGLKEVVNLFPPSDSQPPKE